MFQGYTQGTVDFLWNLRFNNERGWFQEHKEEFLALVDRPTRALAAQLAEEMTEAFPKLGLELKVSRIYRDARRLFGRGPYKDHLWFSLRKPGERDSCIPCFWFEVAPAGGVPHGRAAVQAPQGGPGAPALPLVQQPSDQPDL